MYLKRIELQGFKSFADKTVIDVNQGITAIVGPNGSGKSNISDAIRWVMGEQSAKALRGGKMEDVIFNGTQKRKPLGYAEVSMIFDNSSGFLPCEYTEVEITRRVFRSGEGDYMINRTPCRLKDIHELFMDTGMGRDGYSIVGQGKIAEIVSQKGEERRTVFEEAAGISKYRYRKQEAERKLSRTEDNLTRVRDILTELEGRVEPLQRQSEKAIKYLNLREELKGIEVSALLEIIDLKRSQLAQAEEKYTIASRQLDEARQKHAAASAQSEELFEQIKEKDGETERARELLSAAEAQGAALEGKKTLIETNIANAKENILRTQMELKSSEKKSEEIKAALSDEEERKNRFEEKRKKMAEELEEAEGRLREATREMAARNNALESAREHSAELGQKKAQAKTKIEGLDALKKTYEFRVNTINFQIDKAKDEILNYSAEADALQKLREEAALKKENAAEELDKINRSASELNSLIQEKKNQCNAFVSSLGEKRARLNMLKEMERGLEGYARSVRELIGDSRSKKYKGNMVGVLSKLIKTDKQYITAIEVALGGAMQNIVVKNEADAKEAIEYLKQNKMGRVTFLPISTQEGRRLDGEQRILASRGAVAIASDLVVRDPSVNGVIESLLGRVLIVDNMDNAAKIAKENRYRFKIVTLSGELLQPGGSITGGSINKSQALLQRGEEIEALEKECGALDKQTENIENEIDRLIQKHNLLLADVDAVRKRLSEADGEAARLNAEGEMKQSLLDMTRERIEALEEEKEDLAAKRIEADESLSRLDSVLYGSDGLIEGAEKLVSSKQEALNFAMELREKAADEVTEKRVEISSADKDIDICAQKIAELNSRLEGSLTDGEQRRGGVDNQKKRITELNNELSENEAAIDNQSKAIAALKEDINLRLKEKSGTNKRLEDIREEIKNLSDNVFVLQEEAVRLETRKSKLEGEHENASNRLWDDYELTYNGALPLKKEIGSISAAQKQIGELKGKIKALGNINVDSIEEYKEVKQRYEFMTTQVSDLEEAKKNLEKLISEMLSVMQTQFGEKFKVINENFNKIFADLFGGGYAGVRLSDPKNVLESGIEIEVQPPGKKLQSISLLSGGEHALTAIALLFALLKVSPSPFIVLDEIEAALDDENVYRFADYIKNYDNSTQFVIITHRRGTMEAANILYGVTMQEKGISKLLSMSLEEISSADGQ